MVNNFEVDVINQLNTEINRKGRAEVEALHTLVESNFDKYRDSELKNYLHLMPYIFILIQVILTRKVPARIQEIRLLTLTLVFHSIEISSEIKKSTSFLFWTTNYAVSLDCTIMDTFCYWLKLTTLIFIVIIARKVIEKKKLARRNPFVAFRICPFNSLDAWIILATLVLNFFYPFRKMFNSWATILSIRGAIDLIECGSLFANFTLKGSNINKTDMIGFGLTILANTYDYKTRSIFPIIFALYFICIGLFDKLREWIEVHVRVTPGLEAPKNEIFENGLEGEVQFEDQFEDRYFDDNQIIGEGHLG